MEAKTNAAYEMRLKHTAALLGKDQEITKIDEETGETVVIKKKNTGKPISREDAQMLQYKALVNEGQALYRSKEYRRAIDVFTQAMDKQKDDQSVLIDRANCYIQVGQPEDALRDINVVLRDNQNNPRAILTKAEAYFAMGEFEFALVFFQRGFSQRRDMSGFKDGVTKCKSAILDSINGVDLFQANPNFVQGHPRRPLVEVTDRTVDMGDENERMQQTKALLPEKVEPLPAGQDTKEFLGELALDYEYLLELREEVTTQTDEHGKKEDEQIASVVGEALVYLEQRGAFWAQQGATKDAQGQESKESPESTKKRSPTGKKGSPSPNSKRGRTAHYEMSKIQQYEAKYGAGKPK